MGGMALVPARNRLFFSPRLNIIGFLNMSPGDEK
jgi:hypothetical protein